MKNLLLASAAAMLLTTSAFAADMPVVNQANDWSGFYVGAYAGYGAGDFDFTDLSGGDEYDGLDFNDEDGFIGGGTVGFNAQSGNFVYGVEGDIAGTSIHPEDTTGFDIDVDINFIATARARVGYAFGNVMVYATGGAAFVDVDATYEPDADSDLAIGWTAGAGVEWMFTDNLSAKLEYAFIDAKAEDLDLDPDTDIEVELHTVKVGLAYHF